MENQATLLLGCNLGDRHKQLEAAIGLIKERAGDLVSTSSVYETVPWGFHAEQSFLNQAIKIKTSLIPDDLLKTLLEIERVLGRKRNSKDYESRLIDIDIIFYDDLIIKKENLQIPHPRMHLRRFTLIPVHELGSDMIHPVFLVSIDELLANCEDKLEVNRIGIT